MNRIWLITYTPCHDYDLVPYRFCLEDPLALGPFVPAPVRQPPCLVWNQENCILKKATKDTQEKDGQTLDGVWLEDGVTGFAADDLLVRPVRSPGGGLRISFSM